MKAPASITTRRSGRINMSTEKVREVQRFYQLHNGRSPAKRVCGPCSMCCTTLRVNEIDKPQDCRCQHITQGRSGVYKDGPAGCSGYHYMWLMGMLPNEMRPDKIKAVIDCGMSDDDADEVNTFVRVQKRHEGAHLKSPLREWIAERSQKFPVFLIMGGERK